MVWSSQKEAKKAKGVLPEDNQDELQDISCIEWKRALGKIANIRWLRSG